MAGWFPSPLSVGQCPSYSSTVSIHWQTPAYPLADQCLSPGRLVLVQRQPEASIEQIPRAFSPTSLTPDELDQNDGDEGNAPVRPTPTATHESVSRNEAGRRALGSHGPVYQTYYEYGNHRPQNKASKFGIPLISLTPNAQHGVPNHGGQPYQHDWGYNERENAPHLEPNTHTSLHGKDVISSSLMFSFPVPAIAMGWGFVEVMAFNFVLKGRPGPGVLNGILPLGQLGLSLVLALACLVVAYLQWTSISKIDCRCNRTPSTTLIYMNWQDLCQSQWPGKKPYAMAIAIINIVTAFVYAVLFVAACMDTIYGKEEEE
ncbi:unnamed protein product [Clonostachys chloroleuca]|uniref:MARVEL domain-containing protein n=1 Tax=Clonostachys chloroleuca TaxID=1926264 RepID=A0AA35QF62_9HYPO|nr:unnamed protein product [Clonostachys chloroleuca]